MWEMFHTKKTRRDNFSHAVEMKTADRTRDRILGHASVERREVFAIQRETSPVVRSSLPIPKVLERSRALALIPPGSSGGNEGDPKEDPLIQVAIGLGLTALGVVMLFIEPFSGLWFLKCAFVEGAGLSLAKPWRIFR